MANVDMCEHDWPGSGCKECRAEREEAAIAETVRTIYSSRKVQLTGGRVNYYLAFITHPQREEQAPYQAECEDLIEALRMTPDEANIFKEIWRSAAARLNNGKPGHTALYGAEKMVHYANRILRRTKRETDDAQTQSGRGAA